MTVNYNISNSSILAGPYDKDFGEDLENFFPRTSYSAKERPTIQQLTIVAPSVELFNIEFRVHSDGTYYHLVSDQWPILTVFGSTFKEAVQELQALLKDLIQEYVMIPIKKLAPESIAFRNFLLSKLFQ